MVLILSCNNALLAAHVIRGVFICGFSYPRSKNCLFEELILQYKPYIGLFIRCFIIRDPVFEERIYREKRWKPVFRN
jgi:hypothetical protein